MYIKDFLGALGHDGLNKMLAGFDDKSAVAQCIFGYCAGPEAEPKLFIGRVPGQIVPKAGPENFGWDPVFKPDGYETTYAQMEKSEKNTMSHRARALAQLLAWLSEESDAATSADP